MCVKAFLPNTKLNCTLHVSWYILCIIAERERERNLTVQIQEFCGNDQPSWSPTKELWLLGERCNERLWEHWEAVGLLPHAGEVHHWWTLAGHHCKESHSIVNHKTTNINLLSSIVLNDELIHRRITSNV